jgi:hypothetical protein
MVVPPVSFQPQARRPARQAGAGIGQRSHPDAWRELGQRLHVLVHIPDAGVHARRGPPAAQPERDELAASVLAGEADLLVASMPS